MTSDGWFFVLYWTIGPAVCWGIWKLWTDE